MHIHFDHSLADGAQLCLPPLDLKLEKAVASAVIFALSSCSYKEFKTLLSNTVTADICLRNIAQPLNGL